MSTTTATKSTPVLLTPETEEEVREALLRLALSGQHQDLARVEHHGELSPVGPMDLMYRRGEVEVVPLEVDSLGHHVGAARVSQAITAWAPPVPASERRTERSALLEVSGRGMAVKGLGLAHAALGEYSERVRRASLADGTEVVTGTYSVDVWPRVPLLEDRTEGTAREALGDGRNGRQVQEVGKIEGTPDHRTQVVKLSALARPGRPGLLADELRGSRTIAGCISRADETSRRHDVIGDSIASASSSRDRMAVSIAVEFTWRER